ncbi:MAG: 3-phosphoshikimate 1-carboxyvinyltransferase [Myxococcaceae bacterium]
MGLTPPISKSDAHRALVLRWLFNEPTDLGNSPPRDVVVLQRGLEQLRTNADRTIDCHDAGAPFRILVALAALTLGTTRFTGTPRLAQRPHAPLYSALGSIELGENGFPIVHGAHRPRDLRFTCTASDSSQYATALLLASAAHLLRDRANTAEVVIEGQVASAGYLALTIRWLEDAGFTFTNSRLTAVTPHAPTRPIPGDWSSLGYLLLIAHATGHQVASVGDPALHPDGAILGAFAQAGLRLDNATLSGKPSGHLDVSANAMPDAMLTLAALACVLPGPSTFRDLGILRHKESDRVESLRALVTAAGGRTELHGDTLQLLPPKAVQPLQLHSRDDHRLAMSAATLAALAHVPLHLSGADCVEKSFPTFFRELRRAGVTFELR